MRSLITGISGFAGSHLAERLVARGDEVTGVVREGSSRQNLAAVSGKVALETAPLRADTLTALFERIAPDRVFHLAGQAHVAQSWQRREGTFEANVMGTLAVMQAASARKPHPKVLFVSTGEIYGRTGSPFREEDGTHPDTPYSLSKVMAESIALAYARWDDLPLYLARPFNHTGPRQSPTFVCSEFSKAMAEISLGIREPRLVVGNLGARRDFSDVRDIVMGYDLVLERGVPGRAYNLCTGRGVTIQHVLDTLLPMAGRTVSVEVDPAKFRPLDSPEFVGDPSRARAELSYVPEHTLEDTLRDLFDDWRRRLS
ncbi:MAG: GDP-mannose 4,6-dehydratase [Acidobacteriota bacterium]